MKNLFIASLICSAILAQGGFAQEALRKAVDSNNWKKVKKIVNSGELEEIYCGKLSPTDAVSLRPECRQVGLAPSSAVFGFQPCGHFSKDPCPHKVLRKALR